MKSILCLTDLSENANHALSYGYEMAKRLEAELIFCNIINIPAEIPQYEVVMWPLKNFDHIEYDNKEALKKLKKSFEQNEQSAVFHPPVSYICESGTLTDAVSKILLNKKADMIIAGTHTNGLLKYLLLGNHIKYLIDTVSVPLLLIPPITVSSQINWIGFATDLNPEDYLFVSKLTALASDLEAPIILMYVDTQKNNSEKKVKQQLDKFVSQVKKQCHYPKISGQYTADKSVISGLKKLSIKNEGNGILAIAHKNDHYINEILKGSYTQKIARQLAFPLLVIPSKSTFLF